MQPISLLPKNGSKPILKRKKAGIDPFSWPYALGITSVAIALCLLPLSYFAILGSFCWLLYQHVTLHSSWVLDVHLELAMATLYVSLTLFLSMMVFFTLRPLLPIGISPKSELALSKEKESRLFAFVQQVCSSLGSPMPVGILVNMEVNASARFARGFSHFWRGRLELILGLPLIRGLNLAQFAALLAHEMGHFRQPSAMRLVHGIKAMNNWFSIAATCEEGWLKGNTQSGYRVDPFLILPLWSAKGCSWMAKKIMLGHMHLGQATSCLLLRQMEFEADHSSVRIVGGEVFSSMVLEAKILESAWGLANRSLGMSLREGCLADDLPELVAAHTRVFIPEVRRKMERTLLQGQTKPFDTHPSLGERVRRARLSVSRGMFHSTGQAATLFADFTSLSRKATIAYYRSDLGEDFNPSRMISTSDLVTGQSEIQVGESAVNGYFLGQLTNLRPIWLTPGDFSEPVTCETLRSRLNQARKTLERDARKALDLSIDFSTADGRLLDSLQALTLMRANFWIEPSDFNLIGKGSSGAAYSYREAEKEKAKYAEGLFNFEQAMKQRLVSALGLLLDPEVGCYLPDAKMGFQEVMRLLPILEGLAKAHPNLEAMRRTVHSMGILFENLKGNEKERELQGQLRTHALGLRIELETLVLVLTGLDYPFGPHGRESGLDKYALDGLPEEKDYLAHYLVAEEVQGRLYALYFRILGRLALSAGRVEGVLGLGPLQVLL